MTVKDVKNRTYKRLYWLEKLGPLYAAWIAIRGWKETVRVARSLLFHSKRDIDCYGGDDSILDHQWPSNSRWAYSLENAALVLGILNTENPHSYQEHDCDEEVWPRWNTPETP